jgi:hypothetical protein
VGGLKRRWPSLYSSVHINGRGALPAWHTLRDCVYIYMSTPILNLDPTPSILLPFCPLSSSHLFLKNAQVISHSGGGFSHGGRCQGRSSSLDTEPSFAPSILGNSLYVCIFGNWLKECADTRTRSQDSSYYPQW